MEDVANDQHFIGRGAFAQIDHPLAGSLKYPGRPFVMTESPWEIRRPAPMLGQHNGEILQELGYGPDDQVRLRAQGVI
jgi:crotonobetainyl-CoA:carnitine CoA-transferase CaiB-like acyl-CoA transferase